MGYELFLATEETLFSSKSYSWLPVEVVVVVVIWLLKSYWKHDSLSFKSIRQHSAASMLTRGDHPFATITMEPGSEHSQQPHPLLVSSGEQVSGATTQLTGTFNRQLCSYYGRGNGGPQQPLNIL
ncbi:MULTISPECIES: hypothetical protein [unclassified Endozoicomonas]|uniref:hypothetical protein n=1 Tax=unclassified Endozoicomonas TaxID=2644528 RepID=UPI002147C5EE|nr:MULTISPECIES: hypothetical protein [unclassified Endozoicomonas]